MGIKTIAIGDRVTIAMDVLWQYNIANALTGVVSRIKEGDASPYPIEIEIDGRTIQARLSEVALIPEPRREQNDD